MEPEPLPRMTLGEHFRELRSRLLKSLVMLLACLLASLSIQDRIVDIVLLPHQWAQEMVRAERPDLRLAGKFMAEAYAKPFFAYFKLALLAGIVLASPFIAYQIWEFIAAGLYPKERRWVYRFAPLSFALFVAGCVFGFELLIPYCLYFLTILSRPEHVQPLFGISGYIDLVILLTVVTGVIFQIPVAMMFFSAVGLVGWRTYVSYWRWAVVLIFIVAAVLTPPDPVSQILMAVPMIGLYFGGAALAAAVQKRATS